MQWIFLTLVFASNFFTATAAWGSCENVPVQQNFTMNEYLGTWYEIERSGKVSENGKCLSEKYDWKDKNQIELLTQIVRSDGAVDVVEGELMLPSDGEKAKFYIRTLNGYWTTMRFDFPDEAPIPYWVVSTDYTSYSLVYSCSSFLKMVHTTHIWILSRERQLSENTTNFLHDILRSNNINIKMFQSDQEGCPSYK